MTDNITVTRELLRQAIEAIDDAVDAWGQSEINTVRIHAAQTALRAALEQPAPVQEPDAFLHDDGYWTAAKTDAGRALNDRLHFAGSTKVAVYTAPQAQQPDRIAQLEAANTNLFEQGQKMHKRIQELEAAPVQESVCRGCGIPANDIHMSTCPTKKWPMRVTLADAV